MITVDKILKTPAIVFVDRGLPFCLKKDLDHCNFSFFYDMINAH